MNNRGFLIGTRFAQPLLEGQHENSKGSVGQSRLDSSLGLGDSHSGIIYFLPAPWLHMISSLTYNHLFKGFF